MKEFKNNNGWWIGMIKKDKNEHNIIIIFDDECILIMSKQVDALNFHHQRIITSHPRLLGSIIISSYNGNIGKYWNWCKLRPTTFLYQYDYFFNTGHNTANDSYWSILLISDVNQLIHFIEYKLNININIEKKEIIIFCSIVPGQN